MTQRTLTVSDYRLVFIALAIPFYLNDLAFIALNGTYGVYLADYISRVIVLAGCVAWPVARLISLAQSAPRTTSVVICVVTVVTLPILSPLLWFYIEIPFVQITGLTGLFKFPSIDNHHLYWLDLTVGLLLVALSEELVFRKFARAWLAARGLSALQIVLVSALFFSLMHWGSGPGRLIATFIGGAIYMAVYLKIGRLWPLVTAHFLHNFYVFGPFDL